jgi:hypothetical protein
LIRRIAQLGGVEVEPLILGGEEHSLAVPAHYYQAVEVIGGIEKGRWQRDFRWAPHEVFQMSIATPRDWFALPGVEGFLVRDDSCNSAYPSGTIVFAAVVLGNEVLSPREGDHVLVVRISDADLHEVRAMRYTLKNQAEECLLSLQSGDLQSGFVLRNPGFGIVHSFVHGVIFASYSIVNPERFLESRAHHLAAKD